MSRPAYSRLCCLIHDSLHPFTEKSAVSITKEQEKALLIVLSQVLNKIKLWTAEFDSDSNDNDDHHVEPLVNFGSKRECATTNGSLCHPLATQCVFKIVNNLVFYLAVESPYVQHLTGNVLVAISEFVVSSESCWDEFMQALCLFLEREICNLLSPFMDPPSRAKFLDFDLSAFKLGSRPILNTATWFSVGGIIRVLRNVLKQLKHVEDVQHLEVYLFSLGSCFSKLPWDLFTEVSISQNGDASRSLTGDALINNNVGQPESWFEFCGYLVQLLCSLVSQISLVKAAADSLDKHPAIHEMFNMVPKVLAWSCGVQRDLSNNMCISQYIQHKILVLMIRLSSLVHLDREMVVSWLNLIHKYFQDLLLEHVTLLETGQNDSLEDSPFLQCLPDVQTSKTSYRHLQRLVIFLFLRCSFGLISLRDGNKEQCLGGDLKSYSKKGIIELYEWLQKHLPADILMKPELYSDRCKCFAKSFLQLYMHEDDLLFEVLLQLSYMPFGSEQWITKEWTSQVVESNILSLMSDIFHPIHLFHLFLAELLYDHQVLLDYLISKDTGASCAEYLLRCLRIICDSWNTFLGFSFGGEIGFESSCKRRKVVNDLHLQGEFFADVKSDEIQLSSEMDVKNRLPFQDASECLLSLKDSLETLHQKELFPYNPEVLLRRLKRYKELCLRP